MECPPLKVLVVDDTVTYRKILSDLLREMPDIELVGTAVNGRVALEKIPSLQPDCITLDLEMPDMDGLAVLRQLRRDHPHIGAIMLSAFTSQGAESTTKALSEGAFDFVLKPSGPNADENIQRLRHHLREKLTTFAKSRPAVAENLDNRQAGRSETFATTKTLRADARDHTQVATLDITTHAPRAAGRAPCELVVIGISTGGPEALGRLLPALPPDLSAPVLIVQHMPPLFTKSLADDLNRRCQLQVSEARNGDRVTAGKVLIAPGGHQMKLVERNGELMIEITDDPPENSCRPAVDYLFRSVSQICGDKTLAVIMTGMGSDGALGCRLLKRRGATVMAQDAASCVVFGMPMFPIQDGIADIIAPLRELAGHIVSCVGRRTTT